MSKKYASYSMMCMSAGYIYVVIELIYRQRSDVSMMLVASICAVPIIFINNWFTFDIDYLVQILSCSTICTLIELIAGLAVNADHSIWDYSEIPFNYRGQICLPFFLVWIVICAIFIVVMDWVEYNVFGGGEVPYYKIFGREIFRLRGRS